MDKNPYDIKNVIILLCAVAIVIGVHMGYTRYKLHVTHSEAAPYILKAEIAGADGQYDKEVQSYLMVLGVYRRHYAPDDEKVLNFQINLANAYLKAGKQRDAYKVLLTSILEVDQVTQKNRLAVAALSEKLAVLISQSVSFPSQQEQIHIKRLRDQAVNKFQ